MSGRERNDKLLQQLGEEARARAAAAARIEEPRGGAGQSAAADRILAAMAAKRADAPARPPTTIPRKRGAWLAAAVVPLAAAAAIVIGLRSRAHETFAAEYVASVTGHVATERAGHEAVFTTLQATDGALEQVIVRPREATKGAVAAKVLVVRPSGVEETAFPIEVSELGVVRFDAAGEALRGASEVRIVIAPPDALDDAVKRAKDPAAPPVLRDAVVVRVPVER
jgi:hypothetical protein